MRALCAQPAAMLLAVPTNKPPGTPNSLPLVLKPGNYGRDRHRRMVGTYTVTVTDANGCSTYSTSTININTTPVFYIHRPAGSHNSASPASHLPKRVKRNSGARPPSIPVNNPNIDLYPLRLCGCSVPVTMDIITTHHAFTQIGPLCQNSTPPARPSTESVVARGNDQHISAGPDDP